jgi:5-formyltetrahydrofolate cyclo-ligase
MGGGFYDRTFADRPRSGRPILVAAVHPEQLVERIVTEAWDVAMDAVVLPDEVIVVEGTNRDDGRSGGGGTG